MLHQNPQVDSSRNRIFFAASLWGTKVFHSCKPKLTVSRSDQDFYLFFFSAELIYLDVNLYDCCLNQCVHLKTYIFSSLRLPSSSSSRPRIVSRPSSTETHKSWLMRLLSTLCRATMRYRQAAWTHLSFSLSGLCLLNYIWLWFETPNNKIWLLKSKNASPIAAPCQTADIQTRARALKWWLKIVACSDYESEQMADTAIFSSLTISLPSVIVTLRQVQKEVCVWVCVWMKLDDDWMHGGRKKKTSIIPSQSATSGNVNNSRMISPFCVHLLL